MAATGLPPHQAALIDALNALNRLVRFPEAGNREYNTTLRILMERIDHELKAPDGPLPLDASVKRTPWLRKD